MSSLEEKIMCWEKLKNYFSKANQAVAAQTGLKILTIEDDATQRTLIQRTLEKKGHSVLIAEDGRKGLELAQRERPDLIILDVVMPQMRGDEVCRRLKTDSRTKDIPVLFLTSLDTPKDVIEHYDLGADVHLTKPINPKELIRQVDISLKGK